MSLFFENTAFLSVDDTVYVVNLFPYSPWKEDELEVVIDSYYLKSNEVYFALKEFRDKLRSLGVEVLGEVNYPYKTLLEKTGLAYVGRNQLCQSGDGSFFVIGVTACRGERIYELATAEGKEIVVCRDELEPIENVPVRMKKGNYEIFSASCKVCKLCEKACPTGAISNGRYDIEKCLRLRQESMTLESGDTDGKHLLGCNRCALACPKNRNVRFLEPSEEEKKLFSLKNFIELCLSGKKALAPYAKYLGDNYLRPHKLLYLALCVYKDGGYTFELDEEKIRSLNDEKINEVLDKIIAV